MASSPWSGGEINPHEAESVFVLERAIDDDGQKSANYSVREVIKSERTHRRIALQPFLAQNVGSLVTLTLRVDVCLSICNVCGLCVTVITRCNKNSSGDEIANVNFLTTISNTRRPTSKYRKRDKPTTFNKLDDR